MSTRFPFSHSLQASGSKAILTSLEDGNYQNILQAATSRTILSHALDNLKDPDIVSKLRDSLEDNVMRSGQEESAFLLGLATLQCFIQSNVTGPPLEFDVFSTCFQSTTECDENLRNVLRSALTLDLGVDGDSVYSLTPHIELFWVARCLLNYQYESIAQHSAVWAGLRINFWHQKLLSEPSPALQGRLFHALAVLENLVLSGSSSYDDESRACFLIERAAIRTFYDADKKAREDLDRAAMIRDFHFVLTGRLGRRTKFQQFDISQLVVLAKSHESTSLAENSQSRPNGTDSNNTLSDKEAPRNVDLNDDTLLERISFTQASGEKEPAGEKLPPELDDIDPANQPLLHPLDSAILLAFASSVTNTSPDHGLTREETLPYATRVLDGGSSNWQVYTQALLVRSRIESHKSRTVERGVLQLQALVDQVIAATSGNDADNNEQMTDQQKVSTFLPKPTSSESASAAERLRYIHQLSTPPRWALEGELAARWASLGGLRTALEIYERLEMWAEASLCLAATDQEAKAIRMVRKQLFEPCPTSVESTNGEESQAYTGPEKHPSDAPRLFCILGDFEEDPHHYERAWAISKQRYFRAQRSLGKYYVSKRELEKADAAYVLALRTHPQNAATWFALGCVRLETQNWAGAVSTFKRVVGIEHEDAEAWSNLAAALVHLPANDAQQQRAQDGVDDEDGEPQKQVGDPQTNIKQAFVAFKHAAALKRDSYRIWQNVLNTGARLAPPPFTDLIIAQRRLIEIRGAAEGESCIDTDILEGIIRHVISQAQEAKLQQPSPQDSGAGTGIDAEGSAAPRRHGLEKMLVDLMLNNIAPLITRSRQLWQLVARLDLHLNKPSAALEAYEKAWRATLNRPGWDDGGIVARKQGSGGEEEDPWMAVQEATEELADAYESLGEREVTEGLKAGSGELVCKNWRFKARTAVRSVVGRRTKAGFDDVERLKTRLEGLSG